MYNQCENLVFSGGGILGIAYMGTLDYLYKINFMKNIKRMAGSSAGAIAACISSFDLSFEETKKIVDSLDYSKVPSTSSSHEPKQFTKTETMQLDKVFGNVECVYRLVKKYGWYSSCYFYDWIRHQIANQFDPLKKAAPYTFEDFMNPELHKDGRSFKELYIIGTDVSSNTSTVFSVQDTPHMEVAEAVRISMSVPIFFEAIKSDFNGENPKIYADGGVMYRYPITLFDGILPPEETLGALIMSDEEPVRIENLVDYISNLISCVTAIQAQFSYDTPENRKRTMQINTGNVSSLKFDVKTGDATYNFLYEQGYKAAENYFNTLYSS